MTQIGRLALATGIAVVLAGCASPGDTTPSKGGGATEVTFEVTGTAPSGVDITYGNDSSNYQGSAPPFQASLPIKEGALYYAITAQLQGGGDVTCRVTIGDAVKEGQAVGGYNICSAQLNSDPLNGGWG